MVSVENWGISPDGQAVKLFSFSSSSKFLKARATNYGATLVSLQVEDGKGGYDDLALGYDTFEEWLRGTNYFGCTVGRYGNRIKQGRFSLNGKTYQLQCNNGKNHLHGGLKGFDKRVWSADVVANGTCQGVRMTLVSKDGDEGYPGELVVTAWILLGRHDELLFKWKAEVTGSPTVVNLTNHTYWNLSAWCRANKDVLGHHLTVDADRFVEVDDESIPTGTLLSVEGTVLDFRRGRIIGHGVADPLLQPQRGYDHTVVFPQKDIANGEHPRAEEAGSWTDTLPRRATLVSPETGYGFHMYTSQPGVQIYTANYLEQGHVGYGGRSMLNRGAVCLEAQHFPDSPNQPSFPSTVLHPGEVYEQTTVHRFFASPHPGKL